MDPSEWIAVHDHEPPGPKVLTIRGTVELPTPGYSDVHLEPAEPQGATYPHDYLLEVRAQAPPGQVPQVVTAYPIEYREETEVENETVSILPNGPLGVTVSHPE